MKRLVSSQQKIGNSVGSYTYYSYDDMGRAYRSDFCLINTMGGTLSQTYTYTYKDTNEDGSNTDASKKADGTLKSINVNYDAIASANETISYNYDNLKRISGKVYSGGLQYNYTYKYLNDARTTYLTNAFTARFNSSTLLSNSYEYDAIGNITAIRNNGSTVAEYTYDEQNQLTSEKIFSQNIRYDYWYDTYGNLTSVYEYNLSTGAYIDSNYYSYGSNGYSDENGWHDRLTSFDGGNITYDAIGNPLSYYNGSSYTFTWQNGRELASAVKGGVTTTYKYGADGLRVQKKVGNDRYYYYYSEGLLMRQTWGANYIDFLYDESDLPYSFIYNGTQYYYIKNLQNDVIAIANTSGSIVVNYTYDAWGNVLSTTGSMASTVGAANPIRYRSYYYDTETGFYYLQTRYYDPAIRRFINADGYLNANGDILGFNMYAYCGNNPVNYVDYGGCKKISVWESFCFFANVPGLVIIAEIVSLFVSPSEEEHYARNENNIEFPAVYDKELFPSTEWNDDVSANCHQFSSPDRTNKKYVSEDGKYEVIYNSKGERVDDPRDIGTYNFASPDTDPIGHFFKDVYPWIKYGNSENDTTSATERFFSFFGIWF